MNRETGHIGDHDDSDGDSSQERRTLTLDVFQLYRGDWRTEGRAARADDIRQEVRHGDQAAVSYAEFSRLFDHKGTETVTVAVENTDEESVVSSALGRLWGRWNRGSGRESQTFVEAETRSLEVADLVAVDGDLFFIAPIGWREVEIGTADDSEVA